MTDVKNITSMQKPVNPWMGFTGFCIMDEGTAQSQLYSITVPSGWNRGAFQIEDVLPVLGVTLGQDGHAAYDVATGLFHQGLQGGQRLPLWR